MTRNGGPMASFLSPLLAPELDVVFVGTEPGTESLRTGSYYANPRNSFYRDLKEAGLTTEQLQPSEFERLLEFGIGLDDVYQDPRGLRKRIEANQPRAVCFNSKDALRLMAGDVPAYWMGEAAAQLVRFTGVELTWAIPDSSPTASAYRAKRRELLAQLAKRLRPRVE